MSKYDLCIRDSMKLEDYSIFEDYLYIVQNGDSLDINLNEINEEDCDIICSILIKKGFEIESKEMNKGKYHICALRKNNVF